MKVTYDRIEFYVVVAICNFMTWGMFQALSMPPVDVSALTTRAITGSRNIELVATVGNPVRVVIPDIGMDLPVAGGTFDPNTQSWTLSDTSAYHAAASVPANDNNGTTLLYGHARPAMFGPLTRISAGTKAYIHTDNGKIFSYMFESSKEVLPTDTTVFTDAGPPTMVMQTCSGPWDSYRSLYSFRFVEVRDA